MKIFKKIADFFTKKERTAQKQEEPVTTTAPTTSEERACRVRQLGETETPLFIPQPLMQWYGIFQAMNSPKDYSIVNISQVEMLDLFNPLTSAFLATVFALKNDKQFIWGEVGTRTVYISDEDAFIYKRATNFRLLLKKNEKDSIMAVCRYKEGEIIVTSLIRQNNTPPVDSDKEVFIECPLTPCNLKSAAEFAEKLS